ncbi:Lipoxygenase [Macleaya cordata]|uniref:Lipoxygenase n=1 Tax=Macleaya cordata TaxID=56857 RepID=A0A200Q2B0_MACCD|nr:Lipoxygenase [Macleaya cordata]
MGHEGDSSLQKYLKLHPKITDPLHLCSKFATHLHVVTGKVVLLRSLDFSGPGKSGSVQLCSSTQIDPGTGKGKLSEKARFKKGKSTEHNGTSTKTYKVKFYVEPEFGIPGALIVKNRNKHEFFLYFVTVEAPDNCVIRFECNSWVYPFSKTKSNRLFFSNTSYLPNKTPNALMELRKEELITIRGDGTGEREKWDRFYDYDYYNDLGNPDKDQNLARPILGGSQIFPYPRRGRTGRPSSNQDPLTESREGTINLDIYVPPDERFSPMKMSEFISNSIRAIVHFFVPEAKSLLQQNSSHFESFSEIRDVFVKNRNRILEGWMIEKLKTLVPDELLKEIHRACKENSSKFPIPQIIAENELAWKDDAEFAREMLAGLNPGVIQCLQRFPPESKNGKISKIRASHIEHRLEGLTLEMAMQQWRIFILDHHDYLMPFLNKINTAGVCAYASRTLLFLKDDATLKPLVIELSLPGSTEEDEEISRVFLPATQGTEAALWQLAKTHVVVNDSGYHQLISHWLKTHAVVEPFIIATRRQLSEMHPIHRLLDPHFKDTMHINALARSIVLNAGGGLEKSLFTGKISMELSSMLYKDWRFDEQGLPADLVKRRLAIKSVKTPSGVQLLFDDYPYGIDGLDIWMAIKTWVTDFCSIFYTSDETIMFDREIQEWWSEIRNVGHGDKCNETWWYNMTTISDLVEALTTLIWISSALHASVNFGQYGYGGYPPNRPSLCRKFIPNEGTFEFAEFLRDPDKYFLKMLPERIEMTLGIALLEILSRHTSDEVYLGQRSLEWTDNEEVRRSFEKFRKNLLEVEKKILTRNKDPNLKNRLGPARIPYTLLYPDTSNETSKGGLTGKGIPNSVSI